MKNKQIQALEKLIEIKDQTIKELEKQIQILKNQSIPFIQPLTNPYPLNPLQTIATPNPLFSPYIITCENGTSNIATNGYLAPVTLSSSCETVTLTNSNGNVSFFDSKSKNAC